MNEQTSHQRHRLSQSNNKDGSRIPVGRPTYRPRINRGDLVSQTQDNIDRENTDMVEKEHLIWDR
jgi:hypothetical protein